MSNRRLIERYIIRAIFPYALAAFILLTGILFVQQSGRYFETIFQGLVPAGFMYSLALALLPTVLIFTLPMAILSGTIIGLGRMGSDSELVAMRAAGVSSRRMVVPAMVIGLLGTFVSLQLNLNEAPQAQQQLRSIAVRSALYKLDSPVEPQTFTTDIPGYAVYVREGDKTRGQWGGVFLRAQDADGIRLITARAGRIDSSDEKSELVLEDAVQTRLPPADAPNRQYVVERLKQLRVVINTGRNALLARMQRPEVKSDGLPFTELRQFISQSSGPQKREAVLILHKRLALAFSPLVFSFFGAALSLRMRRGSRGFGALVSLFVMVVYYLLIIAGEQMTKGGRIPPIVGGWLATALTLGIGLALFLSNRSTMRGWFGRRATDTALSEKEKKPQRQRLRRRSVLSFPTLLDTGVVRTMGVSFLFAFFALVIAFDVFTSFELWRFLTAKGGSVKLLLEYLFYLLPLVSVELFPASVLVAALMTYALIARRRESVAWWASGQSVYRLMLPGLAFAIAIAGLSWLVQERVMPQANVKQDNLRARIRGNIAQTTVGAEQRWLVSADGLRIYSYDFDDRRQALNKPAVYEFGPSRTELRRVITGEDGIWVATNQLEIRKAQWFELDQAQVARQSAETIRIDGVDPPSVFRPTVDKPSQLDAASLRTYIKTLKARGADTATLAVGLQRKYASPFSVIIMALIGMPLAVSLGRKSTVVALCSAVVVSLFFWLLSSGFHQLGEHALLPPEVAAWAPIAIVSGSAFYFISRVRT